MRSKKSISWAAKSSCCAIPNSCIVDEEGINSKKCEYVMKLKNVKRGRIKEYAEKYDEAVCYEGKSVWDVIRDQGY